MTKLWCKLIASLNNRKADGAADEGIKIGNVVFAIIAFIVVVALIIGAIVYFKGQYDTNFTKAQTWMNRLSNLIPTN